MNQPDEVTALRNNVFELVSTSRRLLQEGMVDISPVENGVRAYCEAVASLSKEEAKTHSEDLAKLTQEMAALEQDLKQAYEVVQRKLTELGQHHKANIAYKKVTGNGTYKPANDD